MNLLKKHPGGRPKSPNPKMHDIKVRVDEQMFTRLNDYATDHHQTIAETIRQAIDGLILKSNQILDDEVVEAFKALLTLHTDNFSKGDLEHIRKLLDQLDDN